MTQVVAPVPAVPLTVQLLNTKPEFAVAVMLTVVPPPILLDVQVPGQLMPPVLLVTVPPPVGDMTAVMVSEAKARGAAKPRVRKKTMNVSSRFMVSALPP